MLHSVLVNHVSSHFRLLMTRKEYIPWTQPLEDPRATIFPDGGLRAARAALSLAVSRSSTLGVCPSGQTTATAEIKEGT